MFWTCLRLAGFLALLQAPQIHAQTPDRGTFPVTTSVPTVTIAPRDAGRNFIRLPSLQYTFTIRPTCTGNRMPDSLTLNVADTRKTIDADDIESATPTRIELRIPARQIAPLAIESFCTAGREDAREAATRLSIAAVLSAQVSLLCVGDEDQAMVYVSRPLDLELECRRDDVEED